MRGRADEVANVGLLLAAALGLCPTPTLLAQTLFSPPSAVAKVTTLTGQVSVYKESYPWALQVGSTVEPKQLILSGPDGYAVFQVSDGSTFEVFPNSRVVFRDNIGNLRELLDVVIGRVRVHIEKLGGQPNPNKVKTPTAVISVRGTTFDVIVEDEDATTQVSVEEGQVEVQHSLLPYGRPKLLNPGDSLRVYKNQPLAKGGVDRGRILNAASRALSDALYTIIYRTGGAGGSTGTGGGPSAPTGTSGDTGAKGPPPVPPQGPPAPPGH